MSLKKTENYNDIIHLRRPRMKGRDPMSMEERAAQFSPFAALTGYDGVIQEAGRLTAERTTLDEDFRSELNEKFNRLAELTDPPQTIQTVVLTWFEPDSLKLGGEYRTETLRIRRVDRTYHLLELEDRSMIEMEQVYNLWWEEEPGREQSQTDPEQGPSQKDSGQELSPTDSGQGLSPTDSGQELSRTGRGQGASQADPEQGSSQTDPV